VKDPRLLLAIPSGVASQLPTIQTLRVIRSKIHERLQLKDGQMTKARVGLLAIAGIGIVAAVVLLVISKFHYVDPKPALALGEEYFSNLEQNQLDEAFDLYTEKFLEKKGQDWERTIADLDVSAGKVTSFKPQRSSVAPVTLRDGTELACEVISYQVVRASTISDEKLTICPHQRGGDWGIAGHEITRSDTGEHFEAGLTIVEKKILSTN
jgi:hypothetical protein